MNILDRNNALAVLLMGALPPVAGSAISFLLAAFLIWGIISLLFSRIELRLTHSDRQMTTAFSIYAVAILMTGVLGDNRALLPASAYHLLPFLGIWIVISRLRASPNLDYLTLFIQGGTIGCIAAFAFSFAEIAFLGKLRAEGGAGNPIVFSIMCLCLVATTGIGLERASRPVAILRLIAIALGIGAIVLSLSRGVMLLVPVILVCIAVYLGVIRRLTLVGWTAVAAGIFLFLLALISSQIVQDRVLDTLLELEQINHEDYSGSIGERLRLWNAAWQAFLESPIWGHGIQNRMAALVPYLASDGLYIPGFSHAHSAYISAALDGGIVAVAVLLTLLAAPIVIAWRAPRDRDYRRRLYLTITLTLGYALVGMTQLLFKHDIIDSFYIFACAVITASIPAEAGASLKTARPAAASDPAESA